jgi:putative transposase
MKYEFIEQHEQEFPIVVMCHVLSVSESSFYAWRKRPTRASANEKMPSSPKKFDRDLALIVADTALRACTASLRDQGRRISRKRVARLMREAGLCARRKQRRVLTTKRDATHPVAPNLLERDFTALEPNKKWVTDITSIPTAQGWLAPFRRSGFVFPPGGGLVHVSPL